MRFQQMALMSQIPMRTVLFVRHGESQSNAGGPSLPHADIPLTRRGLRQAHALASLLPQAPGHVLCSRFLRARQTARPYCRRVRAMAQQHPLLHEFDSLDFSLIEGLPSERRRPLADAFWARGQAHERSGPQAETFAEFATRVQRFIDIELPNLPDASVLFGHGQWMGLLAWRMLGFDALADDGMRRFRRFQMGLPMPNGAVYRMEELSPGQWRLQVQPGVAQVLATMDQR